MVAMLHAVTWNALLSIAHANDYFSQIPKSTLFPIVEFNLPSSPSPAPSDFAVH
jgi:hypothetical protein